MMAGGLFSVFLSINHSILSLPRMLLITEAKR